MSNQQKQDPVVMPKVFWDSESNRVVVDEDWLREEIRDFAVEAKVRFTRQDYNDALEQLRMKLLGSAYLRAVLRKKNGKPSTPSKFRQLESYTVGWFKEHIRRMSAREQGGKRGRTTKTERSLAAIDAWAKEQADRENKQR